MGIFHKHNNENSISEVSLRIVLEHAGTPLYELNTTEYSKEIIIGRGLDCIHFVSPLPVT